MVLKWAGSFHLSCNLAERKIYFRFSLQNEPSSNKRPDCKAEEAGVATDLAVKLFSLLFTHLV